ncbi:hypothetical protein BH11PAT4_BH11PAT4_7620 [soil metagenome]
MKTRKNSKKSLIVLITCLVLALVVTAFAQKGGVSARTASVRLTDVNLLALQVKQNQYEAAIAQRDAALASSARYQQKLEQTQLSYNEGARATEAQHQRELAAVSSTKNQYAALWQAALKPTPFYGQWWFILTAGLIAGASSLAFVQWTRRAYGSFWKWVSHVWNLRPRVTVTRPTHG